MARDGRFTPKVAAAIQARAGYRCERCGESCRDQRGFGWSIQHRTARGMGGTKREPTAADGALLCGSATTGCHGFIEANPDVARAEGWRVDHGTDPHTVPIRHWYWGSVLLDDAACYEPHSERNPA